MAQAGWRRVAQSVTVPGSMLDDVIDPGSASDVVPLSDTLVAALATNGWLAESEQSRLRWLRLAACHSSYLYELAGSPISPPALTALGNVGSTWLMLAVADLVAARSRPAELGTQNRIIMAMYGHVAKRLVADLPVVTSMHLGKGEEPNRYSAGRLASDIILQVLGVVALFGGYETIKRLVASTYDDELPKATRSDDTDWWHELARHTRVAQLKVREYRVGSDHNATHVVEIEDNQGRKGRGEATRKKLAKSIAAEDFLRRNGFAKAVASQAGERAFIRLTGDPRMYTHVPESHAQAVARLGATFAISAGQRAYLQQALTHASWTHENARIVQSANQRDYGLLANHGSFVINATAASTFVQTLLHRTLHPTVDEAAYRTLPEESYVSIFNQLLSESAVLRSRGLREYPLRMKADVVQAVAAVLWRYGGSRGAFRMPEIIRKWISEETLTQGLDEVSRLERICSTFGGELSIDHTSAGPDHQRVFSATLRLRIGELTLTHTGPPAIGKTPANRTTAGQLLRLLALEPTPKIGEMTVDQRRQASRLLLYLARHLPVLRGRQLQRCIDDGVLGLGLLAASDGSTDDFLSWANEVDLLVGPLDEDVFAHLHTAYRNSLKNAPRPKLEQALQDLSSWVQDIDPEGDVAVRTAPQWDLLLAVASTLRAATAQRPQTVDQIISRWKTPTDSLNGASSLPATRTPTLSAGDASAIAECLNWTDHRAGASDAGFTVQFRHLSDGLRVECSTEVAGVTERMRPLAELLAEAVPGVQIFVDQFKVTLTAVYIPKTDERSIAAAGILATRRPYDQSGLEFLANVLHRLKNELIGLEDVVRRAQTKDRVTRLERLVDAARHHESACNLAEHLGRTRHAIADADEEMVQIGRWLDEYCASKTLVLKHEIRLIPPARAGQCEVRISPSLLREVLDNLVKNSVEAMPDGGQIAVDWYVEPGQAMVLVHDDGPGLSDQIRQSFLHDETLPSSKSHGSGLGLWLVKSALHRMNASISDDPSADGQRWLIELPCEDSLVGPDDRSAITGSLRVADPRLSDISAVESASSAASPTSQPAVRELHASSIPGPRRQVKPQSAADATAGPRIASASTTSPVSTRSRNLRVLLVDDQENVARTMAQHLQPVINDVDFAFDGSGAMARLREAHYDVVVTDLQMPPGTWGGLWLLEQMRVEGHRTPVVVLSGEGGQEQTIDALNAGAKAYVPKAQAAEQLADRVKKVVSELRRQVVADLQSLPLPVALGLQRFQAESDANLRLRFGHQTLEDSLRFLGCVGLAELQHEQGAMKLPSTVRKSKLTLGSWSTLGQLLRRSLGPSSYAGQVLGSVDYEIVRAAVTGRNQVGHGSEPRHEDVARMLVDVGLVLEQLAACLHRIVDRNVMIAQSLDYDGQRFPVSAVRMVGTGPVLPSAHFVTGTPVARNSVGLHRAHSDSWIPLGPWMIAEPGDARGEWRVSVFDGVDRESSGRRATVWYRTFGSTRRWSATADAAIAELTKNPTGGG